jgi:hypothetical protein
VRLRKGIEYRELGGYKYQTLQSISVQTSLCPDSPLRTDLGWVTLDEDGLLTAWSGYAWDGPSGPTFDTASTLRASLFHDCLYQLMREKLLDLEECRKPADDLLRRLMVEDGAWRWRAWLWLKAVR